MSSYSPTDLEAYVRQRAPEVTRDILHAAKGARNEADLVAETEKVLERFGRNFDVTLNLQRERTLINGRADAVYNRFVIEYEPPGSLRPSNNHSHNKHAIGQVTQYMDELERLDRHRKERLAGVVLDGGHFIFVRHRDERWRIDDPVPVNTQSTETFLRYLLSLATELALTPENLVRDFGENSNTARQVVPALYNALRATNDPKVKVLFQQWRRQFQEVFGYDSSNTQLDAAGLARLYAVRDRNPDIEHLFFAIHTYYATFIKVLALQVAHYYLMPKVGTGLAAVANYDTDKLRGYLIEMERGGLFTQLGIRNFLEGDFFGWYLEIWDDALDAALRRIVGDLANYSLVTLDVDPEETRDLLKHLYQNLVPKKLRHALGEYYTPDWLAERLLNQLGYAGDPAKRILDPACGSGTFLVLAIKRIRQYADEKMLQPAQVLEQVLSNVVGFDLNPLAVISARTNYLLALGELLQHRRDEITIPVYLADSVLTPSQGADLYTQHGFSFQTAVGRFTVPRSLVEARYIDQLAHLLEECVHSGTSVEAFRTRLVRAFPLNAEDDDEKIEIEIAVDLYKKLLELDEQKINGIWARIIKNAFAPRFQGRFDYVAGNPPWVNWASLPREYREEIAPLWQHYDLFPHTGLRARLGGAMDDISVLLTYVAADQYLKPNAKLGFVITQSVFKTEGGGAGFRRFQIGDGAPLKVMFLDDMSSFQPFDSATNRTAVVIIQKGHKTTYPVQVNYWRKRTRGSSVPSDTPLNEVIELTKRAQWVGRPVNNDLTSPWIIGRVKAIQGTLKCVGLSPYKARYGTHTHANGIFWLEVIVQRPDGLLVVGNLNELAKKSVDSVQMVVESEFVHPLLRGRDVERWAFNPTYNILLPQDVNQPSKAYPEDRLEIEYPKTFAFLKHFEGVLRARSGYRQFFDPSRDPFYSIYNVGAYTYAQHKVLWREVANDIRAAVVETNGNESKVIIPDHTLVCVSTTSSEEAHFVCALLNSSPADYVVRGYIAGHPSTNVLKYVAVPKFDVGSHLHNQLADCSQQAHAATAKGETERVREIEAEIDQLAKQLWGLTDDELREIQESLTELG